MTRITWTTMLLAGLLLVGLGAYLLHQRHPQRPELILFSGAVNRRPIEPLLKSFSEREGIEVTTVYNGCGILCGTMRMLVKGGGNKLPDAYYACDSSYLEPVADLFSHAVVLTETDIVIAVPKGNPKQIKSLRDLARPGLRVGLCNAEQSTLGGLTQRLLQAEGLAEAVARNVKVEEPTADLLVNQLQVGPLDAIVVYDVNVRPVAEHLQAIPIHHPGAKARQAFAVRNKSPRRELALRLLRDLQENRAAFEAAGFRWVNQPYSAKPLSTGPDK